MTRRALVLASLALLLSLGTSGEARAAEPFVLGWNQAWLEGKWASDLSSGFAKEDWRRVLRRTRTSGGSALRVWLYEDRKLEGVVWDGHRPAGVDPAFLANVRTLAALAAEEKVKIYWTAFDGNWFWEKSGIEYERVWNVVNDKYGFGTAFRENVLGPTLDAIRSQPGSIYAFDLVNEIQGWVKPWIANKGWESARAFMSTTAAFVHARAPGVRVTTSSGHGEAWGDLLDGRFDGLGFDFLDVHVYTDALAIPEGKALVAHARRKGVPLVLGEFGQSKKATDDAFQARQVKAFLEEAKRLGFAAAFPWRLEDQQKDGARYSFFDGERERPAVAEARRFGEQLAREAASSAAPTSGLTGALDGGGAKGSSGAPSGSSGEKPASPSPGTPEPERPSGGEKPARRWFRLPPLGE